MLIRNRRGQGFFWLVILVTSVGGMAWGECPEKMSWEILLEKHERCWAELNKIDVQYRYVRHRFTPDGKTLKRKDVIADYHWFYSAPCEKLFFLPSAYILPEQRVPNGSRNSIIRTGNVYLSGDIAPHEWDAAPQSFIESLEKKLVLNMLPNPCLVAEIQMPFSTFLARRFFPKNVGNMVPLGEHAKIWKNIFSPMRTIDSNGDVLWLVRLETPVWFDKVNQEEKLAKEYCTELVFNESKNFLLQRYSQFFPAGAGVFKNRQSGNGVDTQEELIVLEYQEVKKGIYFPKCVAKGVGNQESKEFLVDGTPLFYQDHYYIDKVLVNEQVKDPIRYEIPENFWVYRDDLPADLEGREKSFAVSSIWGKNNKPLVTFLTLKEQEEYMGNTMAYPLPVFGISKTRIACIVIGLIMIITALIRLYFIREKKI